MADQFKILAQVLPATTNDTWAYIVPTAVKEDVGDVEVVPRALFSISQVLVTSIIVCNLTTSADKFSVRLKGGTTFTETGTTTSGKTVEDTDTSRITDGLLISDGPLNNAVITAGTLVDGAPTSTTEFEMDKVAAGVGTQVLYFMSNVDNNKEYLFYDTAIAANATQVLSLGLVLSSGNVIEVKSNTAPTLSFTIMGIEVT